MKRFLGFLVAVLMMIGVVQLSGIVSRPVFAGTCSGGTFLGFKPWYDNLECENNAPVIVDKSDDGFAKFVWTIILNVAYDLFIVIGIIAAGFVIYAGYVYLTAGGDPGKAGKAKKSLVASVVGILVALSASTIINTITDAIGEQDKTGDNSWKVLEGGFNLALSLAGIVATGFIIYGGISYATSAGDPGKVRRARMILLYSIIGLVVVIAAFAIVNFVVGAA